MLGLNTPNMNSNPAEMGVYSRRPNSKSAAPAQSRAYNAYGQVAKETFENELQREMAHIAARQGAERLRHQKIMAENKKRLKAQQELLKKDLDVKKQEEKEILSKYKENKKTAYVKYLKETSKELMKNVRKEESFPHNHEQQYVAPPPQDVHYDSNYTKKNFTSSIEFLPRNKKQRLVGVMHAGKSVSPSQKQIEQIVEEDENEYYSKNYLSENDPGNNYKDIISQYYLDLERVKQNKEIAGVIERQKVLASLNQLSGNTSTRNNKIEYYGGNDKTPSFANHTGTAVNKQQAIEKNQIKKKVSQAMEDKGAYVDSFNFDEEMNRIETGFGETVSKEGHKKFLVESSNLQSNKPAEDPYLKFLEYQNRKTGKQPKNIQQQKLSGSVDSSDRAPANNNFKSTQNVAEENEQQNKWTPPARLRSMESKQQEDHHQLHYQNINVNNNFVASLHQDFVKEDDSTTYKTFKLPGPQPTRKEEVIFSATAVADRKKKPEEPPVKQKTPPLNMNDKRSLIYKQQSSLPEKSTSSRASKAKVNLHQKIPPPMYSKAPAIDEQSLQENYKRLNEEEANLQNEIIDLHLKEMAKVRHVEQKHQLNGRTLFPNFPNVVKEEELEESLDRLDTTGAKPKVLPTPAYLLNHQQQPQNPQSQISSSSHFYAQQQQQNFRDSPALGLPVISHHPPQRFMPQMMQVSSHNLTNQYNKNSATAFQGFPPSSTTSYSGNPFQQYPINYRSVNLNDDVSSHASLNMNHSRVSFERFTPNNRFGTGQPLQQQQQQWQKAYGNNNQGPDEIRDQQVFGRTSLNKESERLMSSTENLKQTNPNDISDHSSEFSDNLKSVMKGGGGRSTIRDESVGYGTRKQQMKDYQLKKKIAAQQKKDKQVEKAAVLEPPPIIEKETIEGGMKVVTNTNLIHLLMGGSGQDVEEEKEEEEEGEE